MIEIINEDTLVSELELTVRSEGVLRKRGIILVSDLTKVRYGELGRFKGIGKVSYHEIKVWRLPLQGGVPRAWSRKVAG